MWKSKQQILRPGLETSVKREHPHIVSDSMKYCFNPSHLIVIHGVGNSLELWRHDNQPLECLGGLSEARCHYCQEAVVPNTFLSQNCVHRLAIRRWVVSLHVARQEIIGGFLDKSVLRDEVTGI